MYHTLIKPFFPIQGSVSAMAVTIPLDTARTRLLLDSHGRKDKGTIKVIAELVREEGV